MPREIRQPHPSGRPIRERIVKSVGYRRVPHEGPLTPGLRGSTQYTQAIGFTANLDDDQGDE